MTEYSEILFTPLFSEPTQTPQREATNPQSLKARKKLMSAIN